MKKGIMFLLIMCVSFVAHATVFDDCQVLNKKWGFYPGGEFPGATGSLSESSDGLKLEYDFTNGGAYVGVNRVLPESSDELELAITLNSPVATKVAFRITDATNRVFQTDSIQLKANEDTTYKLSENSNFVASWNGVESKTPKLPWKDFHILIDRNNNPVANYVTIKNIDYQGQWKNINTFTGEPVKLSAFDWQIDGTWGGAIDAPTLILNAIAGKDDATLKCTRLTGDRPVFGNYALIGGATEEPFNLSYFAPMTLDSKIKTASRASFDLNLGDSANPYNIYQVELTLSTTKGDKASVIANLNGEKSNLINFGKPKKSEDIKNLNVGTNAHMLYCSTHDTKTGKGYKKLIDIIADAGFKYIRDSADLEKGEDGKYHVRPYDIEWMKYAKSRGLEIILVMLEINYPVENPKEMMIEKYKTYATELKGLVNVFEIGNETNWSKIYPGGTWNGMVSNTDRSTCRSLVELAKIQGIIADAMYKVNPEATYLGLGQGSALNFRMLNTNMSKNIKGVVEHTYTYSLPPEKDVWSNNFERDGVLVGDKEGTFFGLIDSYIKEFKKTGVEREIWMTEFGFPNHSTSAENHGALYGPFTEETVAVYTLRRFFMTLYRQDIIKANIQYDIMRGGEIDSEPEHHFGLLQADFSPTSTYWALQRMNSLMAEVVPDNKALIHSINAPLHRSAIRGDATKWDQTTFSTNNQVIILPFSNTETPNEKMVAVWSAQPYSVEFSPRFVSFKVSNWSEIDYPTAVGIDVVTGKTFDVQVKREKNDLVIPNLHVGPNVYVIKFIKE